MSKEDKEAAALLNRLGREGHDFLGGGADSHALHTFLGDFFTADLNHADAS